MMMDKEEEKKDMFAKNKMITPDKANQKQTIVCRYDNTTSGCKRSNCYFEHPSRKQNLNKQ